MGFKERISQSEKHSTRKPKSIYETRGPIVLGPGGDEDPMAERLKEARDHPEYCGRCMVSGATRVVIKGIEFCPRCGTRNQFYKGGTK